jgi:hypothetical protein
VQFFFADHVIDIDRRELKRGGEGALLLSRILHPLGMSVAPRTLRFRLFRTGGVLITFLLLVGSLLLRFVVRG